MLTPDLIRTWKRWLVLPLGASLFVTVAYAQETAPAIREQPTSVYKTCQQVEQVPIYEGGTHQLFSDISNPLFHTGHLQYSKTAVASPLNGEIVIRFTVDAEGRMQDVALDPKASSIKGPAAAVTEVQEKTLTAVRGLPGKWTPGQHAGKPVPVVVAIVCEVNPSGYQHEDAKAYRMRTSWSLDGVKTLGIAGANVYK